MELTPEEYMQLTPSEIKKCLMLITTEDEKKKPIPIGFRIVVMDRGYIHCGKVTDCGDYYLMDNAKNIRVWGTTEGIGELRNGPLANTKLDELGSIEVSKRAVLFMIICSREF